MANILWIQPNQTLAITTLAVEDITPQDHAKELQNRGDIPADWTIAGYDVEWPEDGYPHEAYRWVDNQIVVDQAALAAIQAKNAQPTVAELQSELAVLTAKIAALTQPAPVETPVADTSTPAVETAPVKGA